MVFPSTSRSSSSFHGQTAPRYSREKFDSLLEKSRSYQTSRFVCYLCWKLMQSSYVSPITHFFQFLFLDQIIISLLCLVQYLLALLTNTRIFPFTAPRKKLAFKHTNKDSCDHVIKEIRIWFPKIWPQIQRS